MPRKTYKQVLWSKLGYSPSAYYSDKHTTRIRVFLEELDDGDLLKKLYRPFRYWRSPKKHEVNIRYSTIKPGHGVRGGGRYGSQTKQSAKKQKRRSQAQGSRQSGFNGGARRNKAG